MCVCVCGGGGGVVKASISPVQKVTNKPTVMQNIALKGVFSIWFSPFHLNPRRFGAKETLVTIKLF